MTSCILLSAGTSLRFGSPKALANFKDKTVIAHLQETLITSGIDEIIVVLGASRDTIEPHILKHRKVKVVHNKDWNLGQTSSLKAGLRGLSPNTQGIFFLPVDFPVIKAATLDILIRYFVEKQPLILIPTYQGRKGHPPVFHAELKKEFLELDDSTGMNTVAHQHPCETRLLPVEDPGVLLTFNTKEEFSRITETRRPLP